VRDHDIIRAILDAVCASVPGVPPDTLRRIDREVRCAFGGERVYIARAQRIEWRDDVSRSTIYRWKRRGLR